MDYTEPLFESEGDPYLDANPGVGFEGSFIPGTAIEARMRELLHLIRYSGQTPSRADLQQVRKAVLPVIAGSIFPYSGLAPGLTFPAAALVSGVLPVPRMPPGFQPRNYLINGSMRIWQRGPDAEFNVQSEAGTTTIEGNAYTADRWAAWRGGVGSNYRAKRASYSTAFPNCVRLQRVAGTAETHTFQLFQVLPTDDSQPLAGRVVTLAFRARAGANFSGAWFGSRVRAGLGVDETLPVWAAGAATGYSTIDTADHAITASDIEFTRTFAVPANVRQLAVEFRWFPTGTAGAADYVDVTAVRLQPGAEAFAQPQTSWARELRACQRFYNKTFDYPVAPSLNTGLLGGALSSSAPNSSNQDCHVTWKLPVEMRVVPNIRRYNPIAVNDDWGAPASGNSYEAVTTQVGTRQVAIGNVPGIPESTRVAIHARASAEL